MKKPMVIFGVLLVLLGLASCATTIPVKLQKPAEIDTSGAKTIAVLPFGFPSQVETPNLSPYQAALFRLWYKGVENKAEREVARSVEQEFVAALLNTNHFSVLKSDSLKTTIKPGDTDTKIAADIVVTGRLIKFSSAIEDKSHTDTTTNLLVPYFEQTVDLEIQYDVIRTATNQIIATRILNGSDSIRGDNKLELRADVQNMVRQILTRFNMRIQHQLAPYEVTEHLALAEDKSHDKQMEVAKKLASDGFIQKAFDLYTGIFGETRNPAAGYNAAICKEALGDIQGAIKDMAAIANEFNDKQALKTSKRMEKSLSDSLAAENQKN